MTRETTRAGPASRITILMAIAIASAATGYLAADDESETDEHRALRKNAESAGYQRATDERGTERSHPFEIPPSRAAFATAAHLADHGADEAKDAESDECRRKHHSAFRVVKPFEHRRGR
jgi:hypothetical protein